MISDRAKKILAEVVERYTQTADPVGSAYLARHFGMNWSPATIRSEMAQLEEQGYLEQPHTSAGRVPTENGYRFYVDSLMSPQPVPTDLEERIMGQLRASVERLDFLLEQSSRILAALAHEAAVVVMPGFEEDRLQTIRLVKLEGDQILVVLTTRSGWMIDQRVEFGQSVDEAQLKQLVNFFQQHLGGVALSDIPQTLERVVRQTQDSLHRLVERMQTLLQRVLASIHLWRFYREGERFLIDQPEFQEPQRLQQFLRFVSDPDRMRLLLPSGESQGVRILIGSETQVPELLDCSCVVTQYQVADGVWGALGVLGPKRMDYGLMTALVSCFSALLSDVIRENAS